MVSVMKNTGSTDSKQKVPQKSQGRPAGPNTGSIRRSILAAAERLFAQKGYAAVSVKEIADSVNVNAAMIHYYFGSKHKLLEQVLEQALEPLAKAIGSMKSADNAGVSDIVHLLLKTFREHIYLPILVVREVLLPGGVMQEHFLAFLAPRLGGAMPGLLAREQAAGRMRKEIDPHIATLNLISLCAFPFFARNLSEPALGIAYDAAGLKKLEQHIILLLGEGYSA
jgi:TetR/AcrR family transcriptional regulator